MLSACSTAPSVPSPTVSEVEELTAQASQAISNSIPEMYLTKCEWVTYYDPEKDDLMTIYEIHKKNGEKYRECYILHNGLVELLKERRP